MLLEIGRGLWRIPLELHHRAALTPLRATHSVYLPRGQAGRNQEHLLWQINLVELNQASRWPDLVQKGNAFARPSQTAKLLPDLLGWQHIFAVVGWLNVVGVLPAPPITPQGHCCTSVRATRAIKSKADYCACGSGSARQSLCRAWRVAAPGCRIYSRMLHMSRVPTSGVAPTAWCATNIICAIGGGPARTPGTPANHHREKQWRANCLQRKPDFNRSQSADRYTRTTRRPAG